MNAALHPTGSAASPFATVRHDRLLRPARHPALRKLAQRAVLGAFALLGLAATTAGRAQSLATAAANNGSGGVFLNLQPVSTPLVLIGFDAPFSAPATTPVSVEVWTRSGTYVGFTGSSAGWTLTQTLSGVSQGSEIASPFVLTTPISLPSTDITAVYLHAIVPAQSSNGLRYTGTTAAPPQTTFSNADLVLFSDTARTGFVAFAGTQFAGRTFSGVVRYDRRYYANGFEN